MTGSQVNKNSWCKGVSGKGLALLLATAVSAQTSGAEQELLWGDTHLHTAYSADAFFLGNLTATPDVAYRFARGEPVVHPFHRDRIQLHKPLDFLVVADHAEYMGVFYELYGNGAQLEDPGILERLEAWLTERLVRWVADNQKVEFIMNAILPPSQEPVIAAREMVSEERYRIVNADALEGKTWRDIIETADAYNDPGNFTAFIGWEWSSAPGAANLHRVIMTSTDSTVAAKFHPFGSNISPYPQDLWDWLDKTSRETGAEFIAIPHNSNISKGLMFSENTLHGEPMSEEAARMRMRWEPVVEVAQVKGASETHPDLSPDDEFADFEIYSYTNDKTIGPLDYVAKAGDYVRSGLKTGLALEQRIGVNPFQFGMIGSTDSHTGLSTIEEDNFGGKYGFYSTPETQDRPDNKIGVSGWNLSAEGLAGVWAEENTRESILAAIKRREVYASTGPRIVLKMFGGWDYTQSDLVDTASQESLRSRGVPMGGVLPAPAESVGNGPRFAVLAMKEPQGANLDRIQIVKGWVDDNGVSQEKIFDVAWSPGRLKINGVLEPVGNTVNLRSGHYSNTVGAASLSTVWEDPEFDPSQSAFYYARVLQIPTARRTLYDARALGLERPPVGPEVIQERVYSSPIWYNE